MFQNRDNSAIAAYKYNERRRAWRSLFTVHERNFSLVSSYGRILFGYNTKNMKPMFMEIGGKNDCEVITEVETFEKPDI